MNHNELFPIGEVAKLFHVSISTLRHYDKAGLVRPELTDPDTGYRYYSTRQFEMLNTIRYLRALDLPLEQIAAFLQNRDIDRIRTSLLRQREEVRRRQAELRTIERKIDSRLEQLEDALSSELDVIRVIERPPCRIAAIRTSLSPGDNHDLEYSIRLLERGEHHTAAFLGKVGVGISREKLCAGVFAPYDLVFLLLGDEDGFSDSAVPLPAETCAAIRFQGTHAQAAQYYGRLMAFITQNHYAVSGFSKEITMIDSGLTNDPAKFVTEIQIPIEQP